MRPSSKRRSFPSWRNVRSLGAGLIALLVACGPGRSAADDAASSVRTSALSEATVKIVDATGLEPSSGSSHRLPLALLQRAGFDHALDSGVPPAPFARGADTASIACQGISSYRQPLAHQKVQADLGTVEQGYHCLVDNYVSMIDDRTLLRAVYSTALGTQDDASAPPQFTGDADADWATLAHSLDAYQVSHPDQVSDYQGMVNAMAESLDDRHTYYENPSEYDQARLLLAGSPEYTGIGISPVSEHNHWVVTATAAGGPAALAGVQPGDDIVQVNGVDAAQLTSRAFSRSTRSGPVHLTVVHHGIGDPLDLTISPSTIKPPLVTSGGLNGGAGYIKLTSFSDGSASRVIAAEDNLRRQGVNGLILDLRGNGGGSLSELRRIAGSLVGLKELGAMTDRDGATYPLRVRPSTPSPSLPVVLLIDHQSASASEVLAAATQEAHAGTLVGERSAGAVDALEMWALDDGSVLDITAARLATPSGRRVDRVGVTPDVVVIPTLQDLFDAHDVQLDAAREVLSRKIS